MGQLLMPALIGAGVGAAGSAITGKNPLTGALLGAGLGAGGAGLMGASGAAGAGSGSGLFSGFKGVETVVPSLGSGGYSALGQSALGQAITPIASTASTAGSLPFGSTEFISPYTKEGIVNFADGTTSTFAPDYLSSGVNYGINAPSFGLDKSMLGKSADFTGGGYNPSFFGRISDTFGNPFSSLSTSDKLGLGLKGVESLSPQQQRQTEAPPVAPIRPGNPNQVAPTFNLNPSSNLQNVKPIIGAQPGNELGIPNLDTTIPLTEEELLRLQQMLQTTGFRGR